MPFPFFKKSAKGGSASGGKEAKKPDVQVVSTKQATVGLSAVGVLARPHVTEKAGLLAERNEYVFEVYPKTNALEVKKAVEKTYGVKVVKVNMVNMPSKIKRVGRRMGKTKAVRKAVVSLQKGQSIELMPR